MSNPTGCPVVILDRDGTVIVDKHYLSDPKGVELLPFVASGLRKLQDLGAQLIIITNQSGVGRGFFTMREVNAVHERLVSLLAQEAIKLEGIFVCPHAPDAYCNCRKPKLGLVTLAAKELNLNLAKAFVIGDKPCDIQLGDSLRGTTFLIRPDYDDVDRSQEKCRPHFLVANVLEAAQIIEEEIND